MDLRVMPRSNRGHKYILCIIDEVMNYLLTVPKHQSRSEETVDALIENVITKILCAQLYNNGSRQCIHVFTHELFIQEAGYQNKNSGSLQSSIVTGRTWN